MIIFLFILGISIGSFLNVLIDRLPQGIDIVKLRSRCDFCKHPLTVFDLIPILSFIIIQGRCRYCKKKLSRQYPLVEFITGIMFVLVYYYIEPASFSTFSSLTINPLFIFLLMIFSSLLVITVSDFKYRIIPDQMIIVLILTTIIYQFFFQQQMIILNIIVGMVFLLFFLGLVVVTRGRGMGLGDVKYAFFMGLLLGYPKILVGFYLSFLTGAIVSLILIVMKKKTFKSTVPFGPFLVLATIVSYLWGEQLINIFQKSFFLLG